MTSIAHQVAARREQDARRAQAVRRRVFWAGAEGAEAEAVAAYLGWSRMGVLTELRRLAVAGEVVPKRNSRGQERWFLAQEGERREPAPAPVAAPETGEADQTAGAGAAVPSETPPPTPSGHGSDEEGTTREVRPTSPAAPTAGDTPPSSGEQEASPTGEPVAALPTPPGCAPGGADGDDHGASVGAMEGAAPLHVGDESPGRVAAPGGETGPGLDCSTRPDVPPAAPAGVTTASSVEREPTSPPESTMRYPEILEHVRQHPGQTVAEVAAALGLDQGTLRGRLLRHGAAMGVEIRAEGPRAGTSGPARPHRLFLSSSPSPSSPPGEAAPASGGDLPTEQQERRNLAHALGLAGSPTWTLLRMHARDVRAELTLAQRELERVAQAAERYRNELDEARAERELLRGQVLALELAAAPSSAEDMERLRQELAKAVERAERAEQWLMEVDRELGLEPLGRHSARLRAIQERAGLAETEARAQRAEQEADRLRQLLAETAGRAQRAEQERDDTEQERLEAKRQLDAAYEALDQAREERDEARAERDETDRALGLSALSTATTSEKRAWRLNRIRQLVDLTRERGQDRDAHASDLASLTVLVEQALSAAGLPAAGDDPLLFRLGRLVERLKAAEVPQ